MALWIWTEATWLALLAFASLGALLALALAREAVPGRTGSWAPPRGIASEPESSRTRVVPVGPTLRFLEARRPRRNAGIGCAGAVILPPLFVVEVAASLALGSVDVPASFAGLPPDLAIACTVVVNAVVVAFLTAGFALFAAVNLVRWLRGGRTRARAMLATLGDGRVLEPWVDRELPQARRLGGHVWLTEHWLVYRRGGDVDLAYLPSVGALDVHRYVGFREIMGFLSPFLWLLPRREVLYAVTSQGRSARLVLSKWSAREVEQVLEERLPGLLRGSLAEMGPFVGARPTIRLDRAPPAPEPEVEENPHVDTLREDPWAPCAALYPG